VLRRTWRRRLAIGLAAAALVSLTVGQVGQATSNPQGAHKRTRGTDQQTRGEDVLVGRFRLNVKVKRGRVETHRLHAHKGSSLLRSTKLVAKFESWDAASKTVALDVAVKNVRERSLFAPVGAIVRKLHPSKVVPANTDTGDSEGSWRWDYDQASLSGDELLSPGERSASRRWLLSTSKPRNFRMDIDIRAGVPLAPGEGGTIHGPGGTSVTVQPNSIPYEVLIDIAPAPASELVAPTGDLKPAGLVEITFEPTIEKAHVGPPTAPLEVSVPAPPTAPPGSEFLVAEQVLTDFLAENQPTGGGLTEQLVAVDTASLAGDKIVTHPHILKGIFGGGLFGFFFWTDSGFVSGTVRDATGVRPGAVVSSNTNPVVVMSDATGGYTLPVSSALFPRVTAFDPFRGSRGSTGFAVPSPGATVTADIALTPLATPPVTRDGVRNGGFERGNLTSWATTGANDVRRELVCSGATITPREGGWMADTHTGPGAVGGTGSALKQRFIVPAGVRTLRVDFNFVSEEFPEFVGSQFNDSFRAVITTPQGDQTFAQVSVNESAGFQPVGDCGFPGGDGTSGQTAWRTGSVDVSPFAGTGQPITVDLLFSANDAGDNIYDTHVLVDNIRFATLWLDIKMLGGAAGDRTRVENNVRDANEILSQAGLNVRIRDVRTINDPGGLADLDITWTTGPSCPDGRVNGRLTAEAGQLVGLSRSGTNTDLNTYYVRSAEGGGIAGYAIGPDDFCVDVSILTNSGIVIMDAGGGSTVAHEIGHMLIAPQTAGNTLEHAAPAGNFLRSPAPANGVVSREQSANINRAGAPLLVS
jgi:hypothetical protein